ncbi:MAG: glutathione S-transferase N-terminal domain-containing protein, partial [Alphaproteobacteria bacterium]|nr:glutathione S-transferase N-terminal domain-containing protein [Alphaproteobacteria bacterium]
MMLVGRYLSPFVRRTAITLKLYGMPFEHNPLSTMTDMDAIKRINPVGRVPALVTDDGATLVDSATIIDWLDEQAGPAHALTPPAGPERRAVQRLVAIALGTMEKAVAYSYETKRRPAERQHQPWIDNLTSQIAGGLAALEAIQGTPWLAGAKMTQADVTTAVLVEYMRASHPDLFPAGKYP